MFHGGEDMLRGQRSKVLAGVMNAEPLKKAPRAKQSAVARLWLKTTHLAQMVGEGAQKRSIGIVDDAGQRLHEAVGRHSPSVLKRSHCRDPRRTGAKREQVPIYNGRADRL